MTGVSAFTFGDDGAMYVSQYNWGTQEVSILQVIPEPATLVLLAVGGVCLRRRKGSISTLDTLKKAALFSGSRFFSCLNATLTVQFHAVLKSNTLL